MEGTQYMIDRWCGLLVGENRERVDLEKWVKEHIREGAVNISFPANEIALIVAEMQSFAVGKGQ
jgi:hypothetical protein